MGVLDDIKVQLSAGPTGPNETVVSTPLPPPKKSVMTKVAEELSAADKAEKDQDFAERVNTFLGADQNAPVTLPGPGYRPAKPNLPITYTPRPPINGVAQDPNDLDVFQRLEIQKQLDERAKNFVGPQKPLTDAEIDKMHPAPLLGYGAAGIMDAIAMTVDDIGKSFSPKHNPMLGAIVDQWNQQGPIGLVNAAPQAVLELGAGLGGFFVGTAGWVSRTAGGIMAGENVLDAVHNGRVAGEELGAKISGLAGLTGQSSPMSQGIAATVASPFTVTGQLLDEAVGVFTDDQRIKDGAQLLYAAALVFGGERAVDKMQGYFKKGEMMPPTEAGKIIAENAKDQNTLLVSGVLVNELDPQFKLASAMQKLAKSMDDDYVVRKHFEERVARDMTKDTAEQAHHQLWTNILGEEIKSRKLDPLEETSAEYAARRFPTIESREEVFGPTLGIPPLFTDPKWYWYMREKGLVPKDYPPPPGAEAYRSKWRNPTLPGKDVQVPRVDAEGKPVLDKEGKQYVDTKRVTKIRTITYDKEGNPIRGEAEVPVLSKPEETAVLREQATAAHIPPGLRTARGARMAGKYVEVPGPLGHPGLRQSGMIGQARLVKEEQLGRYLRPEEVVHHKDLSTTNDVAENLAVFPNQKAHQEYHESLAAKELADQIMEEGLNRPESQYTWYIEDTKTGEFMPAGRGDKVVKPRINEDQILYKIRPGKGGFEYYESGRNVPHADITRASKGHITFPDDARIEGLAGKISELVNEEPGGPHQYGWSYHPDKGDSQTGWSKGQYFVSKWPDRGEIFDRKPTDMEIRRFVQKNQDLLDDPRNFVGGWAGDDGKFHLDISTTEATREKAEAAGKMYDQRGVGYDHPEEGYQDIPTGGTGRIWTPEEAEAAGWPKPTERNEPLGPAKAPGLPEGPGGPEGAPPTPGAPPAPETPPAAPRAPETPPAPPAPESAGPADDPAVALFEALQRPGLTVEPTGQAKTVRQRAENLVYGLLDRFYPVHKYTRLAKKSRKLLPGQDPSLMIRAGWLGGVTGRAEKRIFKGGFSTDIYGKNVPNGVKPLSEIYKAARDESGNLDGFDKYLVSRAALEEEGLNRFRKPKDWVHTGVDLDEAKAYVEANREKYDAQAKDFTKYFHSLLDEMDKSGLLDPEVKYEWRSQRPEYAPLRRDLEKLADNLEAAGNKGVRNTLDRVASPIKQRLGSDKPILPPTQAAILMTYEITQAVERQNVARAIVELRDNGLGDLIKEITPKPGEGVPTGPDIVGVRDAGKMRYYEVPRDLANAMKQIHEVGLGKVIKTLSIPSRWLRTGATSAPGFAVRNPIRDWQTAFINSKSGFNPITDFVKGMWSLFTKDEYYWKWKESGAEWSMLVTMDKEIAKEAIREMHAETATGWEAFRSKWIKSPLAYLEKLSEAGEKPTRIGVFRRTLKAGENDMVAAAESRSASTDFWTRGAWTKQASALYTFLNARAQTTYKLAQTAREHPGKFMIKGIAAAAIPTLALYAINRDDPEYWKRPEAERDMFWFLPIKIGGRQVKLPKGEIGILFGVPIEKMLTAMDGDPNQRGHVSQMLDSMFQTVSPIGNFGEIFPTFARPGIEWIENKKFYSDTPIETETDKGMAPYLRYGPQTSETVKAVGKSLGAFNSGEGVSPKKIENTLYGYTGGLGRMTTGLIDWLAGQAGILPLNEKPKEPLSGTPLRPVVQGFLSQRAVGFESEPARIFYTAAESVERTKNTLSQLVKGGKGKAEEIKAWVQNHPNEVALLSLKDKNGESIDFMGIRKELSNLRKMEQSIAGNLKMTAQQKRDALDKLDKRVSALVDPVWEIINVVSSQEKGSPARKD